MKKLNNLIICCSGELHLALVKVNTLNSSTLSIHKLEIEDLHEQQAVLETVLQQVPAPLEKPVVLTIPSSLTFFVDDASIWCFHALMVRSQEEWIEQGRILGRSSALLLRSLRMEGFSDVSEQRVPNTGREAITKMIVGYSTDLSIMLGMNLPRRHLTHSTAAREMSLESKDEKALNRLPHILSSTKTGWRGFTLSDSPLGIKSAPRLSLSMKCETSHRSHRIRGMIDANCNIAVLLEDVWMKGM
ncbi:hypothetical protein BLNAU_11746 [Blattamonas nauphoetae]|uniref:Uncharacterized protein n=1 Tax=Blattamonas nauphoetae TaxID=2049346 RepID=A0ABQ9XPK9_9EUKA|nr:hypothetical protein BLNAU_11746 [Blattamonas nauphoetae]